MILLYTFVIEYFWQRHLVSINMKLLKAISEMKIKKLHLTINLHPLVVKMIYRVIVNRQFQIT